MRTLTLLSMIFLGCVTGGCVSGRRADLRALHSRAVIDLGCAAQEVYVYHLDRRTKTAMGCGRRLVYVEDCFVDGRERQCTWLLDTPTFAQQTWPQSYQAQYAEPGGPVADDRGRGGRVFRTDLYEDGSDRTAPDGQPPRRVRTQLFGDEAEPVHSVSPPVGPEDVLWRRR